MSELNLDYGLKTDSIQTDKGSNQEWAKVIVLLGLAVYFTYVVLTGNITNYVNERFAWLSYVAIVIYLLLGLATPDSGSIVILPPSKTTLRSRLEGRGQDDPATINRRMAQAVDEMSHYAEYDYLLINDQFGQALQQLVSIFQAQRLTITKQQHAARDLLTELLAE